MSKRNLILITVGGLLLFVCFACVVLSALVGRSEQPAAVQVTATASSVALAQATRTPRPTVTLVRTKPPTRTPTLEPSDTPSSTDTPGPTDTPSNTPTITQTPSKTPTPTRTPIPTRTPDPRTQYSTIDIRELESYANNHIGERVRLRGQVFNVGYDYYQIWVDKPGSYLDVAVFVTYIGITPPPGIYEDTYITVYGVVMGTMEGTNAFGATIRQPWVDAEIIEKR